MRKIFELKSEWSGCLCVVNTSPLLLASHRHVQTLVNQSGCMKIGRGERNYDYTVRKLELATLTLTIFSATMCLKLKAYPHDERRLLSEKVNIGLAGNTAKTEKRGDGQDDVAGSEWSAFLQRREPAHACLAMNKGE